jgi:endogenous inhibitor of DNA gyrase (YacG/DUF329 family)
MIPTITCHHCGKSVPCNPHVKNQKYCSRKECQRARMRTWGKRQYKKNRKYQKKSHASQKEWRKKYPADRYQRDYREAHPEYVKRNCELQRKRNKKRRKDQSTMIAKTHTLLLQPREYGAYTLSKINPHCSFIFAMC